MNRALHYSTDADPGIARQMRDGGATYRSATGRAVRDRRTLERIESLAIPPAWSKVWICAVDNGHLQATGRDARRRKQYIYHPAWIAERDSNKFDALGTFAGVLPRIRRAVRRDLALPELCKERVLAAVVQLMDKAFIRVGGERHRRENGTFGLTTLRSRHVRATGAAISLDFRGKAGKRHRIQVEDARVARVVRDCLDLPGQVLFQYEAGTELRCVSAQDVNDYLRRISGVAITSKDFRTWGGTVCAAAYLARVGPASTKRDLRRHLSGSVKAAAAVLGNTPAVCKRSYIHPAVFSSYEAQVIPAHQATAGMRKAECAVLGLLGALARGRTSGERQRPSARAAWRPSAEHRA